MKIKLYSLLAIISLSSYLHAQYEEKETLTLRDRIFFGGNFSIQLGTITYIEVSPVAGYMITPRLASGVGFIYQYYRERIPLDTTNYIFKTNIFGGRLFAQYALIENIDEYIPIGLNAGIIGYVEYEFLNLEKYYAYDLSAGRSWVNNFYLGGGLEFPLSERMKMNLLVLWNLNQEESTSYGPNVRIGFVFFPFKRI